MTGIWRWLYREGAPELFGVRILGHGRAMECFLTLVALSYGLALLLVPGAQFESQATRDLAWLGYGHWISLPLIIKGLFSGYGLWANIKNRRFSRHLRFLGGLVGSGVWLWFLAKFHLVGATFSFGSFFAFYAFWFSIRIMALSLADLPRPGTPGAL